MQKLKTIENELVPVYETSTGEKVVYGTELHKVLEVKSNYREWIKRRIDDIDAVENEDFTTVEISTVVRGLPKKDHIIKLDIAKEMAMLERNEKGKMVRRYFIQVEKKYKAVQNDLLNLQDMSVELQAIIMHDKKIQQVEHKVETVEQDLKEFKMDLPILGIGVDKITSAVKKKEIVPTKTKVEHVQQDIRIPAMKDPIFIFKSLLALAEEQNITLKLVDMLEFDSILRGNRIAIRKNQTFEKIVYELAYELAHYFIHYQNGNLIQSPLERDYNKQAENAAAMMIRIMDMRVQGVKIM